MTSEFDGTEAWAVWNNCNGVFEVTMWRADAQKLIDDGEYPECDVIPVTIVECPEGQHIDRNHDEDIRERDWGHCCEAIQARSQKPTAHEEKAANILDEACLPETFHKNGVYGSMKTSIATALRQVAEAEREACAVIADDEDGVFENWGENRNLRVVQETSQGIASAIRARSQIEKPALAGADALPPAQSLPDTQKD
jgi:hypothetical protein